MKTQINYQNLYDTTYSKQVDYWINQLKKSFMLDDGLSVQTKFFDFKQKLSSFLNEMVKGTDDFTDNYFYNLVKCFEDRNTKYSRDHIKLFFERELQDIKEHYQTHNKKSKLLVNDFDNKETLVYLANYLAIEKLHDVCRVIYPPSDDSADSILAQMLKMPSESIEVDSVLFNFGSSNDFVQKPKKSRKNIHKVVPASFTLVAYKDDENYFPNNLKRIEGVFKELKSDFISNETKLSQLIAILKNEVAKPDAKINWTGSVFELYMTIRMLTGELNKVQKQKYKWETTAQCFLIKGEPITADVFRKPKGSKKNENRLRTILEKL